MDPTQNQEQEQPNDQTLNQPQAPEQPVVPASYDVEPSTQPVETLAQPAVATPEPVQPAAMPQVPQPMASPQVTPQAENPGHTLGIVSIIMDIIGLSVVGIVLGVISRKKSKEAGMSTTLGTVGMWLGIAFFVIGLLATVAFIVFLIRNGATTTATFST